jgi:hypothetical protein
LSAWAIIGELDAQLLGESRLHTQPRHHHLLPTLDDLAEGTLPDQQPCLLAGATQAFRGFDLQFAVLAVAQHDETAQRLVMADEQVEDLLQGGTQIECARQGLTDLEQRRQLA